MTLPTLTTTVREHVCACFTGLWCSTVEPEDAEAEIKALCREMDWTAHTWDCDRGLNTDPEATDPLAVLKSLPALAQGQGTTLLVMRNLHRFLESIDMVQTLETQLAEGKQRRAFVVVLAPVIAIPIELTRLFVILDHDLPNATELEAIAAGTLEAGEARGEAFDAAVGAAAGLTRVEAEGAFALSIVRHGHLQPAELWEIKSAALKKSGLMSLHRGGERFADLGGLESLKTFCGRALRLGRPALPPAWQAEAIPGGRQTARAKGVLLLGVPGTGKSAFAKALGNETGRPTLTLNLGALEGSLVGQTGERTRAALKIADAMSPCILFVDEIEKGLAGSSGQLDGGSKAGLFGTLLTWLNDHTSDVFFIATSNNLAALPPEFSRAGRFNGIFFLDFPTPAQRRAIWSHHIDRFGLSSRASSQLPPDNDWTGAEIEMCCETAALLDLPLTEAAPYIVPIASTAGATVQALRTWAHGRCLSADVPGLYQSTTKHQATKPEGGTRRQIERLDPGLN